MDIKPFLQDLGTGAATLGHEIYIVGGYVRNKIFAELHDKPFTKDQDIDLVINTNAIDFIHRFQKYYEDNNAEHVTFDIIEEFKAFGTIKISHPEYPDAHIELASTRTEIYEEPAAFPTTTIIDDIKEDLPRRDFTINAILESINPKTFGEIIDYVGGIDDMQKGLVRAFHKDSFIDDPTRIIRAIRFAAEYDFEIETETLTNIKRTLAHPDFELWKKKRKGRFEIEMAKIKGLEEEKASKALQALQALQA